VKAKRAGHGLLAGYIGHSGSTLVAASPSATPMFPQQSINVLRIVQHSLHVACCLVCVLQGGPLTASLAYDAGLTAPARWHGHVQGLQAQRGQERTPY
jgi:hypothetical protein